MDLPMVNSKGKRVHKFVTRLYDKSVKFESLGVKFVKYPAASSMLSKQCKYGIVYSQSFRFARRCSLAHDFFYVTAQLIVTLVRGKGYNKQLCLRYYERFVSKRLGLYNRHSVRALTLPVNEAVDKLLAP